MGRLKFKGTNEDGLIQDRSDNGGEGKEGRKDPPLRNSFSSRAAK